MKKLTRKNTTSKKSDTEKTKRRVLKVTKPKSWDEVEGKIPPPIVLPDVNKKLYPSPKKDFIFKARWDEYIEDVVSRENFKVGHLQQLVILCDLYVEYAILLREIQQNGYTYESIGRNGVQLKTRPEVSQLNRVRADIRNYSKTLGLLLVKDTSTKDEPDSEWDEED